MFIKFKQKKLKITLYLNAIQITMITTHRFKLLEKLYVLI